MRWGIRKQHAAPAAQCVQGDEGGRGSKGKVFSFSPLSWLAKVTGKEKPCASAKHAPKNSVAAAPPFPSCLPKRTDPSPVMVALGQPCSPPRRSPSDVVPRRLSVGNDNADAVAVRRQCQQRRRRHCSLGGDQELPPLGRLIPFSLAGFPARAAAAPSDTTDAGTVARARRHRRRRSGRRLSVSGGRRSSSSFSGRMPPRVRVRSPRRAGATPAAAPGLAVESLAVVRRTRDPQRAFRDSMVEMIASTSGAAEELERLLARYLSLNADEHHDCIVKVFRQVWFEYISLLPRPDAGGGRRRPRPPARRRC